MTINVLLVSAGFFHPPWLGRSWLRQTLQAFPDVRIQRAASLEALLTSDPKNLQAIVLFIHQQKISSTALETLNRFVTQGGGLLAVHSATASFKDQPRFFDILGGRFTRHGPLRELEIQPTITTDEIFPDIGPFKLFEEPYEHEMNPACQVHFYTLDNTPAGEQRLPVVWTYLYGQGRVCYCLPGHRSAVMRHPSVREILRSGLAWVCRRAHLGDAV